MSTGSACLNVIKRCRSIIREFGKANGAAIKDSASTVLFGAPRICSTKSSCQSPFLLYDLVSSISILRMSVEVETLDVALQDGPSPEEGIMTPFWPFRVES